jgi:hypothetical protein
MGEHQDINTAGFGGLSNLGFQAQMENITTTTIISSSTSLE